LNDFGAVQRGNGEELASRLHTPVSCTFCTRSVNPVSPGSQRRFWTELMAADSTESSDFAVIPFGSEYLHFFAVKTLIDGLLSEPYSTFTYRYFLRQWSELCFLAVRKLPHAASCTPLRSEDLFGCIIGKAEVHRDSLRGFFALTAKESLTHMFVNNAPQQPPQQQPPDGRRSAEQGDRFGQSGLMSSPSRVLYFRHLPDYATDSEINAACAPFGVVTNILKLLNKKEAFVEFASLQSAQKFMHNTGGNTIVRGKHVKVVYSDRQNLTLHTDLHETPPNNILFVLVTLLLHPVDVDTLFQVFSMAGRVRKVAISPKNGQIQGFVEMETIQEAASAKEQFNGKHIFTGSCHMQIQFSRLTSVDAKLCAKDYTVENPQGSLLSAPQPPGALGPPAYPMPVQMPPQGQPAYAPPNMAYQSPPPPPPQHQSPDDGEHMWPAQQQLYPAPPATSYQRVLWVKNVDERATPQILFNLFGTAGDVMKVKKLFRKRDMALMEFRDSSQAWSALTNLNRCPLIGKILQVSWSHHPYLMSTGAEDDGLTQDFSNSDMHRFRKPESRNFDHIRPPCDTLHISCNIPLEPDALASLFWQYGQVQSCELFKTDNTRATVKMDSVESAVHALVALHGYVMDPTAQGHEKYSGKGIWVAFAACKPRPARGRPRDGSPSGLPIGLQAPPGHPDPAAYYTGYPSEPEQFGNMLPPAPENYEGFQSYGPSSMNRYGHQ